MSSEVQRTKLRASFFSSHRSAARRGGRSPDWGPKHGRVPPGVFSMSLFALFTGWVVSVFFFGPELGKNKN